MEVICQGVVAASHIPLSHGTTNPGLVRLRNPGQTRFLFLGLSYVCLFYHLIRNRLVPSIDQDDVRSAFPHVHLCIVLVAT